MLFKLSTVIFSILYLIYYSEAVTGVPERAVLNYYNPKYVENATISISRFGRNSPYYFNFNGYLLVEWNNNVTFHLVFFEFLSNQYKRSFVEMHFKACDLLSKEPYVGGMLRNAGVECPAKPKLYNLSNLTFSSDVEHVWPFSKFRVDINLTRTEDDEPVIFAVMYFHVVKNKANKKSDRKPQSRRLN